MSVAALPLMVIDIDTPSGTMAPTSTKAVLNAAVIFSGDVVIPTNSCLDANNLVASPTLTVT